MPQEVWNEISKVTSGYRQGIKSECDRIHPDFSAVPELKLGTHIKTEFKCVNVWIYAGCVSRVGCQQIEILNCGIHRGSSSVLMFPDLKPVWYLGLTPVTLWFAWGRQTDKVCIVLQTSHISDSLWVTAWICEYFTSMQLVLSCVFLHIMKFILPPFSDRWSGCVFCSAFAGFRQRSCFSQCFRAMLHLAPQNDSEMRIILNYIRIITRGKWKVWNHVDKCLMKFTVTHINYWKWPPRWNRCIEKWSYVRWWQPGSRLIKTEDGYHLNWSCWRLLVSSCLLDCRVDITFVLLFRWLIEGAAQLRMSRS